MKIPIISLIICLSLMMTGCSNTKVNKENSSTNTSNIEQVGEIKEVKDTNNKEMINLTEDIESKLPIKGLMVECVYQKDDYNNITYFIGNSNELYDKTIQTKIDNIILGADNKFDHIKISYRNGKQGVIIERDIK